MNELGFSEPGDIAAMSEEDIAALGLKKFDVPRLQRLVAAARVGDTAAVGAAPSPSAAARVATAASGPGSISLVRGDNRVTRSAGAEGEGLKSKLKDERKLAVSNCRCKKRSS